MGISKRIYGNFLRVKRMVERKEFKMFFVTFLSFILFFMTFNAYAADEGEIDPDWQGTKEFFNTVSGVEAGKRATQDNVTSSGGTQLMNVPWTGIALLAPELSPNYGEVLDNPNIPNDLKRGLIGMADDAAVALYANYPMISVSEHLAQQWVPGYNDSVTSLYAANHPSGYEELGLSGITPLWTRALNISYIFFIVIMVLAGFMIMFRHKLGGQVMVTLGSVLPKVIISLVIATFSFAIAGFIIDFGGFLIGLIMYVFDLTDATPIAYLKDIMGSVFSVGMGVGVGLGVVGGGLATWAGLTGVGGVTGLGALLTGGAVAATVSNPVGWAILLGAGVLAMIISFIVLGIIFTGAIKVLITLIKAYLQLLLAVILGPILITLGALPGNSHAIKNWFLSVLRSVLVFPFVFFIINLPNALLVANNGNGITLRFPGKLVFEDPNTYDPNGVNIAGGFFLFILRVFVLFFAAQAPKFLEKWFPPDSSKAMAEGFANAKASMSKIPLVGGMFK